MMWRKNSCNKKDIINNIKKKPSTYRRLFLLIEYELLQLVSCETIVSVPIIRSPLSQMNWKKQKTKNKKQINSNLYKNQIPNMSKIQLSLSYPKTTMPRLLVWSFGY